MFSQLKFSKVWFEWCKSKAWYYLGVHRSQFEMGVGDIHFERRSNEMDVGVVHFKNGESYMPRYIRVAVVTYTRQTAPFLSRTGLSAWTGSVRPTLTQQSNWCTWVCTHTGREILWKPSQKKNDIKTFFCHKETLLRTTLKSQALRSKAQNPTELCFGVAEQATKPNSRWNRQNTHTTTTRPLLGLHNGQPHISNPSWCKKILQTCYSDNFSRRIRISH